MEPRRLRRGAAPLTVAALDLNAPPGAARRGVLRQATRGSTRAKSAAVAARRCVGADEASDAFSEINARVLMQLARFFQVVADGGAWPKLATRHREIAFASLEEVQRARERVEQARVHEGEHEVTGTLYYLPSQRAFELDQGGGLPIVRGRLASDANANDALDLTLRPCRARIRTTTTVFRGRTTERNLLLAVIPQDHEWPPTPSLPLFEDDDNE